MSWASLFFCRCLACKCDGTDTATFNSAKVSCVLLQVSDEYNSPEIILLTYPLESMWDGSLTPNQTTYYLQYMSSLYAQTQMQGMSNVYLLQLNGIDFPVNDWCAGHPNVAAHQNIANQLTDYIQAVLPDWADSMYSSMD
jgi:hypothetical protein